MEREKREEEEAQRKKLEKVKGIVQPCVHTWMIY